MGSAAATCRAACGVVGPCWDPAGTLLGLSVGGGAAGWGAQEAVGCHQEEMSPTRLLSAALGAGWAHRRGSRAAERSAPCSLGRESSQLWAPAPPVPLPAPAPNPQTAAPGSSGAAEGLAQRERRWARAELAAGAAPAIPGVSWGLLLPGAARLPRETRTQTPRAKSFTASIEQLQRSFPAGVATVYSVPAC